MGQDLQYTVEGRWPFPVDMLRRDRSRALTVDDQSVIDELSRDYAADRSMIARRVSINLVIENATRYDFPNTARWESFGWRVPNDELYQVQKKDAEKLVLRTKAYKSALLKLTAEEREALDWFRPELRT